MRTSGKYKPAIKLKLFFKFNFKKLDVIKVA